MIIRKILVIVMLISIVPTHVYAQETSSSSAQESKPVEYALPYPGLLPDNPLYFLKAIRDTMQNFFVSSPLKRAEFHLLQADKNLSASSILAQKRNTMQLAGATAYEAQGDFETALNTAEEAKKQGFNIDEFAKKLVHANEKHQEIIKQMTAQAGVQQKEMFEKAGEKAKNLGKKAKSLLPDK